jgi:hypothetical protein
VQRDAAHAIEVEHTQNNEIVRRFVGAHRVASVLAGINADCDGALFDKLNSVLVRADVSKKLWWKFGRSLPAPAIVALHDKVIYDANFIVQKNIERIIENTCLFMKEFTGDACAACIKTYDFDETRDLRLAHVVTQYRDEGHKDARETDPGEYRVWQNTVTKRVFLERKRLWASDDLKDLEKKGLYENARPNWDRYYNATIGVGIRALPTKPNRTTPYAAILCVDNKAGNLNNPVCRAFLVQTSERLAAMVYRSDHLRIAGKDGK